MIHLHELTKEYDLPSGPISHIVAAERLTLEIPDREVFGLVGPNGAGKTTTLKMVCGLVVPTHGRVSVNGVDVERHPEEAQQFIGYIADFFSLYDDLTVREYLDYFARAYKMPSAAIPARVDELIRLLGLEPKRDAFIAGLSRGMKQRVGIARALIHDPPLLVLDEPAAGLDPKARAELKELLRRLNRSGKTIFITSHVLSDLEEICTSVAILEKGRLLRVGRVQDIIREGGAGRRLRVRLAVLGFALAEWLAARSGISAVSAGDLSCEFDFTGSDAELAEFVRALVAAGAPVCGVEELVPTLEKVFSRLSSGEVM